MKVYVFKSLPPILWGYTRDIRPMWALEECGLVYETIGLDCGPNGLQDEAGFESINPFKQVPVIDDDGYILTESGAILLYIAEKSGKLIPQDLQGRAQVYRWLITSLNNVEPFTYLKNVLERMSAGHPMNRIDELLPPPDALAN